MILVGKQDPNRAIITLDDFVVALRARFIHGRWPLVSIDPTEQTRKTDMQIVRFEGGIEGSRFGEDLFDADYTLKQIGMGLLPSGIPGLNTYWDISMERAKQGSGGSQKISCRFWFYPVLPSVSVREDVVAIKGLKVGVFTEVLSAEMDGKEIDDLTTFQDIAGEQFAKAVSDNFGRLSKVHPSFLRLEGLVELVALTKAIEEMDERPELIFWLRDYKVKEVRAKKEVKVLRRKEDYVVSAGGTVSTGYLELSGGVELMAIALRLSSGDVAALREAVLNTRPRPDALSWSFTVGEWFIPTTPEMLQVEDIVPLFTKAVFSQERKYHDDAITLYGRIIELKPDWSCPYNNRGLVYAVKGDYDKAISDYDKALEISPRDAEVYYNKAVACEKAGRIKEAVEAYEGFIQYAPPQYAPRIEHARERIKELSR